MFGRATITLGMGPHSSFGITYSLETVQDRLAFYRSLIRSRVLYVLLNSIISADF